MNDLCRNSIEFNSIRVYLRANSTAQRPITELPRVKEGKEEYKQNKNLRVYIAVIIQFHSIVYDSVR
jgi:hypothetical protein